LQVLHDRDSPSGGAGQPPDGPDGEAVMFMRAMGEVQAHDGDARCEQGGQSGLVLTGWPNGGDNLGLEHQPREVGARWWRGMNMSFFNVRLGQFLRENPELV
jgi:hypothetical protein